jgi:hypothetical protein
MASEKGINIYITYILSAYTETDYQRTKDLCKEAIRSHTKIAYDLIPNSSIKKVIRDRNVKLWNDIWTESTKGAITREFIPSVYDRIKMKNYFYTDFYITQAITEHGKLNSYLKRFNIKDIV